MDPLSLLYSRVRAHVRKHRLGAISPNKGYFNTPLGGFMDDALLFYRGRTLTFSYKLGLIKIPNLVIDISGKSFSETTQRINKYLNLHVSAVLIVDLDEQTIHAYNNYGIPKLYERGTTLTIDALPKFSIDLSTVFPRPKDKPLHPSYSLFDPKIFKRIGPSQEYQLRSLLDVPSKLIPRDVEIFHDLIGKELIEPYPTQIIGPLALKLNGRIIDCAKRRKPIEINGWVESDRLQFKKVRAKGILYIEIGHLFSQLAKIQAWEKLGLIMVCGYGIPRPMTRRLLHRLAVELKLPVYVLTDNDTWGYFIYSVLKRGSVAPDKIVPELAVKDLRFLGHRASDLKRTDNPQRLLIDWKPHWELRLRALAKYPCFRSAAWKKELRDFRDQNGKYEGVGLAYGMIKRQRSRKSLRVWRNYVDNYLLPKLEKRDWLT